MLGAALGPFLPSIEHLRLLLAHNDADGLLKIIPRLTLPALMSHSSQDKQGRTLLHLLTTPKQLLWDIDAAQYYSGWRLWIIPRLTMPALMSHSSQDKQGRTLLHLLTTPKQLLRDIDAAQYYNFALLASKANQPSLSSALHTAIRHARDWQQGHLYLELLLGPAPLAMLLQRTQASYQPLHCAARCSDPQAADLVLQRILARLREAHLPASRAEVVLWDPCPAQASQVLLQAAARHSLPGPLPPDSRRGQVHCSHTYSLLVEHQASSQAVGCIDGAVLAPSNQQ
ncbi:hypothetical protein HaLaN_16636 [Haematococcus lacustris]|uniref:Uncharacterized protein n=1 Tax=Haematococcus lacustris TaxID=44745 RepID=A0A699ZMC8_HAELA|nr:hypothetical protein HaLaN_16636 [Haematococcus lacustris]